MATHNAPGVNVKRLVMTKRATALTAGVGAVLVAAAGLAAATPDQPAAPAQPAHRLQLVEKVTDIALPGQAPAAFKVGSPFTTTADLFDAKGTTKVGDGGGMCAITKTDPKDPTITTSYCTSIWHLQGGDVNISMLLPFSTGPNSLPPYELDGIVNGGTGRYLGASGSVHFSQLPADTEFYQFKVTFTFAR